MRMVMSTRNLPEMEKMSYWQKFCCDYYHPIEFFPTSGQTFEAEIFESRLGDLSLSIVRASGHKSSNMKFQRPRSSRKTVFIVQQLKGTSFYSQDGRSVKIGPNDIACFDNTRPVSFSTKSGFEELLLHVPYDLWNRRFGRTEQVTARVLRGSTQIGAMLVNFFRQISSIEEKVDTITVNRFENATLSLIGAAFGGLVPKKGARVSAGRTALLYQAKMFIEKNLHDPDLRPKKVADFLQISQSYLKSLFHDEDQSVYKWIWMMRLAKFRRDIAGPLFLGKSLSEIAFNAGFSSFSHFSRKFKETYKMTASEYRHEQSGHR